MSKTVYVSIENRNDSLPQEEWAEYWSTVDEHVIDYSEEVIGVWTSNTNSKIQSACWAFVMSDDESQDLADNLNEIRLKFKQDSVVWAEALTTFISNENTDVS